MFRFRRGDGVLHSIGTAYFVTKLLLKTTITALVPVRGSWRPHLPLVLGALDAAKDRSAFQGEMRKRLHR